MVNYSKTTINKEGTLQSGDVTYNVQSTVINNTLSRLYCGISKKAMVDMPDGRGGQAPVAQTIPVGYIVLENGKKISEISDGEDDIPHLTKFKEILDEVLGKPAKK